MKRLAPAALLLSAAVAAALAPAHAREPAVAPASATQPASAPAVLPPAQYDAAAAALVARLRPVLHKLDATGAIVSARVVDLATGRELYADRPDDPFTPASNMKLPVSAAALDRYGPDYQFKTYLALDGDDLWLVGTGDPAPGDPGIAKKHGEKPTAMLDRWAEALKARGVTAVKGDLVYDDTAFEDQHVHPTWSRGYITDWYAAPVAGLTFNDNCVDVTVRPAAAAGEPAAFDVVPPTANVKIVNQTKSAGPGDAAIERERSADVFTLTGGVRATKTLESKCVTDPGAFFADALRTNLASHGITVAGRTRRAGTPLGGPAGPPADKVVATHVSAMVDVLARVNKNSQNLFAECLCKMQGRAYAVEQGDANARGSWANGGAAVKAFLRKVGVDESKYVIVDGSGLSRQNRVTTRGHSDLLVAMSKHKYADAFRASLSVAGVDGTIGKRSTDIAGRVFAKTGYIGGVRALSGYARTAQGTYLAFSIIYNQIPGGVKPYEELQDDACRLMVAWPAVEKVELKSATRPATGAATAPKP